MLNGLHGTHTTHGVVDPIPEELEPGSQGFALGGDRGGDGGFGMHVHDSSQPYPSTHSSFPSIVQRQYGKQASPRSP